MLDERILVFRSLFRYEHSIALQRHFEVDKAILRPKLGLLLQGLIHTARSPLEGFQVAAVPADPPEASLSTLRSVRLLFPFRRSERRFNSSARSELTLNYVQTTPHCGRYTATL